MKYLMPLFFVLAIQGWVAEQTNKPVAICVAIVLWTIVVLYNAVDLEARHK